MKTWPPVRTVPRITVLTPDPGIVFGLSFRLSAHLVVRSEVADLGELLDVDLVVLDVTGADPGPRYGRIVERLSRNGVRVVFLADLQLEHPPAAVVRRPFRLKDLATTIRDLLAEPMVTEDPDEVVTTGARERGSTQVATSARTSPDRASPGQPPPAATPRPWVARPERDDRPRPSVERPTAAPEVPAAEDAPHPGERDDTHDRWSDRSWWPRTRRSADQPPAEIIEEPTTQVVEEAAPETSEEPAAATVEEPTARTVEEPVPEAVEGATTPDLTPDGSQARPADVVRPATPPPPPPPPVAAPTASSSAVPPPPTEETTGQEPATVAEPGDPAAEDADHPGERVTAHDRRSGRSWWRRAFRPDDQQPAAEIVEEPAPEASEEPAAATVAEPAAPTDEQPPEATDEAPAAPATSTTVPPRTTDETPEPEPALPAAHEPPDLHVIVTLGEGTESVEPRPETRVLTSFVREQATPATGTGERESIAARAWARLVGRRTTDETSPLQQRVSNVGSATAEIEQLVAEVPLVRSLPAFLRAVTRTVAEELQADSAGLWQRSERGWVPIEHVGFTVVEAKACVPFDQPLMHEVDTTGGAILIDPVELVQAAVAGIGGAHTRSIMAASISAGTTRHGILTLGRDEPFVAEDLDQLAELALEAAYGIAVAEHLERIGGIVGPLRPSEASEGATSRTSSESGG